MAQNHTMKTLAEAINGQLAGDGSLSIERLVHPADARNKSDLAFAVDEKLLPALMSGSANAAIVSQKADIKLGKITALIKVDRPRLALAKLTKLFAEPVTVNKGIHPTAIIEEGAKIGENVTIGAHTYIGHKASIGADSVLHPQTYVGPGASIGNNALIYSGTRIGANVQIGANVIIHFNASIGADGFSFVTPQLGSVESARETGTIEATNNELVRIASLGSVIIGDDVEIGANSSIDRGTLTSTRIGNGTKIDNQVQIGHNVVIGENCMLCGRVGIAGSTVIGNRVVLGGATGVADHVTIGDDVVAMGMTGIAGRIPARTIVGGIPAVPRDKLIEQMFNMGRLKKVMKKIESLAARMDAFEQKPD